MAGSFLKPDVTLTRLIRMLEIDENDKINKAVAKNRFKLPTGPRSMIGGGGGGAGVGGSSTGNAAIDSLVYNILTTSRLPALYNGLMNITNDDEQRRLTEVKLLKHYYRLLKLAKNGDEKNGLLQEVMELASGMVVVDSPDALAWKLALDWKDVKDFKDLDLNVITSFIEKFPREGMAKVFDGFLHSEISPFSDIKIKGNEEVEEEREKRGNKKGKEKEKKKTVKIASRDDPETADLLNEGIETEDLQGEADLDDSVWKPAAVLEVLAEGFGSDQDSVINYRILGAFYLRIQEYETAVDIAQRGIETIKRISSATNKSFPNSKDHLSLILATAYIYYQVPKNYDSAIKIFDFILKRDGNNIEANIGKGLILREKRQFEPALKLLENVVEQSPNNFQALFEYSWCQVLTGEVEIGRKGLEKCLEMITGNDPLSVDYRAQVWWRIGCSRWSYKREDGGVAGTKEAFNAFVQSLQENPNYAPAYTSLGFFYSQILNDRSRASKCFYKAFEIDSGELDSAYQLATEFADKAEWDLVEVVASRVVESDRLRTYSGKESSWPYRALGIVGLNQRDYGKAVKYFQKALRITPRDSNTWLGLGEAYANSGRHVAASKVYERARELDPNNKTVQYQYGLVLREMQQFDEAISELDEVQRLNSIDFPVTSALLDTYIMASKYYLEKDFYGKAIENAVKGILLVTSQDISVFNKRSALTSILWKSIGDSCEIFLTIESKLKLVPLDKLLDLFTQLGEEVEGDEQEEVEEDEQKLSHIRAKVISCMIKSLELSLKSCPISLKGLSSYNLGLGYLKAYKINPQATNNLHQSIAYLKSAIQSEPRNFEFWNSYGIASSSINVRVSQHCFIRSLGLNPRQPKTWTNLALLYMTHGDLELASEAIDKAQAVDPDFVTSWVCQAVIDATLGKIKSSRNLFEHSYSISNGTDGLAKFLYGLSVLESSRTHNNSGSSIELDTGILALQKYLILSPESYLGLTIQGMLLERTANYSYGIENLEKLCSKVESDYEISESDDDLIKYATAKSQIARLHLGAHQFAQAIQDSQEVLNLLSESPEYSKLLLTSSLVAGIGLYFSNQFAESIEYFKTALEVSGEDQDVVILLVQVLWANGGENEQEVAIEQVYSSIESKGSSVKMTLLLGVIGLLKDPEILGATGEELEALSLTDLINDRDNSIQEVLAMIKNSSDPWKKALYVWPSKYTILKNINLQLALKTAQSPDYKIDATELNNAYVQANGSIQSSQRAIFYSPWMESGWRGLERALVSS